MFIHSCIHLIIKFYNYVIILVFNSVVQQLLLYAVINFFIPLSFLKWVLFYFHR